MTRLGIAAVLLAALVSTASGGVTISGTAPSSDILSSLASGGIYTRLFDEDRNSNHARGQLFSLPDGAGTAYQITAVTVRKNGNQTFANDTLTLRMFEGTQAQWDTGTGHSTATDGGDYYVDTTVTPLHTESFVLNGLISGGDYVTFELATPITVNEDADFGFLMTYDESAASSPDYVQHNEGSSGGRISITTANHSTTADRHIHYFVQGTAVSGSGALTLSNPTANEITTTGATLGATISDGSGINEHGTTFWGAGGALGDNASTLGVVGTVPSVISDPRVGLSPAALYSYAGYATNASEGLVYSATGTFLTEPNVAGSLVVTTASSSSFDISWVDDATADGAVVLMREGSAPGAPSDSSTYNGSVTYGAGDAVGGGYVVHSGAYPGNPITVSVEDGGTYHVAVYAYADHGATEPKNYNQHETPPSGSAVAVPGLLLASPFQDGMVLQRGKPVPVWGLAEPGAAVSVSIDGAMAEGTSGVDGTWKIDLPALAAGGPHTMTIVSGDETNLLTDVLVGDVWIAFGQSNMVRPLREMQGASTYINDITNNDLPIRCLMIAQRAATSPQESGDMDWLDNSNPGAWTSVGTVFAYKMYQATGVPTAIIWAAWGSTSIECWMPVEMMEQFPHFAAIMEDYYANDEATVQAMLDGTEPYNEVWIRQRPHIVYNQMVHPLLGYGISGFVWYQGEANAGDITKAVQYGFTLPGFVSEYRQRFGQGDLPFLGVQLPSYNNSAWPWFRESQDRLTSVSNGHVAVTIDTGLAGNIHPTDKEPIGIRLSLLARKYVLGESIEAHGPRYDSFSVNGGQVTVSFTNADGLMTDDALAPATFEVAGTGQVFYAASRVYLSGTDVLLLSASVPVPVAVRYAWSPAPVDEVNLVNSDGLPAAPFRTDSWPVPGLGAQAPQAVNDSYAAYVNHALAVPVSGVLENDIDLNHDPLTSTLASNVMHGALSLSPDGSFTYTPSTHYVGSDTFTYTSSDGALSSDATVTIEVRVLPEIDDVRLEILQGGPGLGFSWYGEDGTSYDVQAVGTLATGIWDTVTNVTGAGDTLSLTDEMGKAKAYYRVYVSD